MDFFLGVQLHFTINPRKKDLGWGLILAGGNCGSSARYKLNNVGKTVFLTREAAEAALDAMGGENNA